MITAVVCTAKGGALLDNCIAHLRNQSLQPLQIIVVHSFSLEYQHPNIKYLYTYGYHGYAHAVNKGLEYVDTPFFVVLNDDTAPEKDFLYTLHTSYEENRILQPQIRLMDKPNILENTGHWITKDGFNLARGRGESINTAYKTEVSVFSGAAFFTHVSVYKKIGPMEETLFSFGEDLDWSIRAYRLGISIRYIKEAVIYHKLGASHGRVGFHKGKWVERNRILAMIRSWPRSLLLKSPLYTTYRLSMIGMGSLSTPNKNPKTTLYTGIGAMMGIWTTQLYLHDMWKKRQREQNRWICTDDEFADMIQRNTPPVQVLWHPPFF